jgi:hypothetical protein
MPNERRYVEGTTKYRIRVTTVAKIEESVVVGCENSARIHHAAHQAGQLVEVVRSWPANEDEPS